MQRSESNRQYLAKIMIENNNIGFYHYLSQNEEDDPEWLKELCKKITISNPQDASVKQLASIYTCNEYDATLKQLGVTIPNNVLENIKRSNNSIVSRNSHKQYGSFLAFQIALDEIIENYPINSGQLFTKLFELIDDYINKYIIDMNNKLLLKSKGQPHIVNKHLLDYIRSTHPMRSDILLGIIKHYHSLKINLWKTDLRDDFWNYRERGPIDEELQLIDYLIASDAKVHTSFIYQLVINNEFTILRHLRINHSDKLPSIDSYSKHYHATISESIDKFFDTSFDIPNTSEELGSLLKHEIDDMTLPISPSLYFTKALLYLIKLSSNPNLNTDETQKKGMFCCHIIELMLALDKNIVNYGLNKEFLLLTKARFFNSNELHPIKIRLSSILDQFDINPASAKSNSIDNIKKLDQLTDSEFNHMIENSHYLTRLSQCTQSDEFLTINDDEVKNLLRDKVVIFHVQMRNKKEHVGLLDIPEIYFYIPTHSRDLNYYMSIQVNGETRFFEVDIYSTDKFLKDEVLFLNIFKWEQIRSLVYESNSYEESIWDNLDVYKEGADKIYQEIVWPRILTQFNKILDNIKTRNIRIFEVGSGFGQAGAMCAESAATRRYNVTLCPSDIHTTNLEKIKPPQKNTYKILKDVTRSDEIEYYLGKTSLELEKDSSVKNATTSILISSGCLCFGIIPGSCTDDLTFMQKLYRYNIDYIIADGLENIIINSNISGRFFEVIEQNTYHAPIRYGSQLECSAKLGISLKRKPRPSPEITMMDGLSIVNLSFDPDPINRLLQISENTNQRINLLDLRFIYIEKHEYVSLVLLIEKMQLNNQLQHVIFSNDLCFDIEKKSFNFDGGRKVNIIYDVDVLPGQPKPVMQDKMENKLSIATNSELSPRVYQQLTKDTSNTMKKSPVKLFDPSKTHSVKIEPTCSPKPSND